MEEMSEPPPRNPDRERLTELLLEVSRGSTGAEDRLLSAVMADLRWHAYSRLKDPVSKQLARPTELINEAYIKLFGRDETPSWENRVHFFASASRAMHQIIVDRARARKVRQRARISGQDRRPTNHNRADEDLVLALDAELQLLERHYPRRREVVQLKFYGGLKTEEIARILDVSPATVERDWAAARAWLQHRLEQRENDRGDT